MAESSSMYEAAAKLIEQAPPGQVREVIEDLQIITADPQSFMPLALKHLSTYNLSQFQVIPSVDGSGRKSILSQAALVNSTSSILLNQGQDHCNGDPSRYVDPVGKKSFKVEHAQMGTTDVRDHVIPDEHEAFRSALDTSLSAYLKNHFSSSDSACAVFCSSPPEVAKEVENAESLVDAIPRPIGGDSVEVAGVGGLDVKMDDGDKADEKVVPAEEAAPDVTAESSTVQEAGSIEPPPKPVSNELTEGEEPSAATSVLDVISDTITAAKEAVLPSSSTEEDAVPAFTEGSTPILPVKLDDPAQQDFEKSVPTGPIEVAESEEKVETKGDGIDDADALVANVGGELGLAKGPVQNATEAQVATSQATEALVEQDPVYTLQIVGNKYNQSNFWTGRWRSEYVVDPKQATVTGNIKVDVHYFEQGNVQLAASHTPSFPYRASAATPQEVASEIVTNISKLEQAYQSRLNETYSDLGEKAFRSLRRALPITRQKVDWDKIGNYKLGGQIGK